MKNRMFNPLIFFIVYLMCGLLLSFYGPMKYINYNKVLTFFFVLLIILSFSNGYFMWAIKSKEFSKKTSEKHRESFITSQKISVLGKVLVLILVFQFLEMFVFGNFSLSIQGQVENYISSKNRASGVYSIVELLVFFSSGLKNIYLIYNIYFFRRIKRKDKFIFVFVVILIVLNNVLGYGLQKPLGDLLIYVALTLMLQKKISFKTLLKISFFSLLLIILFSYIQSQRYSSIGVTAFNYGLRSDGLQTIDPNHILFKIFGYNLGFGLAMIITGYLSSGYYGLSLALQLPFEWTYGLGSSYILTLIMSKLFGVDIFSKTYVSRAQSEFGRNALSNWHTIFPWLASDYTFLGVIILFLFFGYFYAKHYSKAKKNIFWSVVLFYQMTIAIIFIPANNQLFHGIEPFISTTTILFFYIKEKIKRK